MMDSYIGYDIGDSLGQKDQVYFDRLPSPDSWLNWGVSGFGPPYYDDGGKMLSEHSCGSCSHVGSSEDSQPWNRVACGCPDLQIDGFTGTESMDDMFLYWVRISNPLLLKWNYLAPDMKRSSLIHDDTPATAHNCYETNLPSQSEPGLTPAHSDLGGRTLDVQKDMDCGTDAVGRSMVFQSPPFSTSAGSNSERSCVPNVRNDNSLDQSQTQSIKAMETMDMLRSDQVSGDEHSLTEESVLLGLEAVVNQLSSKTRLCLRDSLYRLAQRSQPSTSTEVSKELPSLDRTTTTTGGESETNTIDRAVANLMFQNPNGPSTQMCDHEPT